MHREACASYDQDTGYIANIDSIRDREYPMLKGSSVSHKLSKHLIDIDC